MIGHSKYNFVPRKVFFTKGVGQHRHKLRSFELALRDAGIQHQNLILVSSIFPPRCQILSKREGLLNLKPGNITFCVFATNSTNEKSRLIAASVGLAVPQDKDGYGYLSEYYGFGMSEERAGRHAEDLAASMLASSLGIDFDDNLAFESKEHIFKMSGKIIKTTNITQSAIGEQNEYWTTVFAGAVFIL
ncbi:MAG: arginine decarboxylase, pyruvoyl-dependent [candidate division WOR-3 bacterium]|nr:arginine decarboxylase, pyruvoyl-dependent [candidate division WOR-3 bacterium]MDH5683785.1 arginine decarboxylase, pyruvoyl-dependent [candidate division WOR-3 bacterium]